MRLEPSITPTWETFIIALSRLAQTNYSWPDYLFYRVHPSAQFWATPAFTPSLPVADLLDLAIWIAISPILTKKISSVYEILSPYFWPYLSHHASPALLLSLFTRSKTRHNGSDCSKALLFYTWWARHSYYTKPLTTILHLKPNDKFVSFGSSIYRHHGYVCPCESLKHRLLCCSCG